MATPASACTRTRRPVESGAGSHHAIDDWFTGHSAISSVKQYIVVVVLYQVFVGMRAALQAKVLEADILRK